MTDPTKSEGIDDDKFERDRQKIYQGFWPKLRRIAGRVPFIDELLAAYYCATDPATPMRAKAILMGALAYFVMPLDTVPDFLAFFGFADDAAVVYAAIKTVAKHITSTHREKARAALDELEA